MDAWKPYLHTSLFSNFKEGGEPFLFPTFLVTGTWTFLGSALFTACLALLERCLSAFEPRKAAIRNLLYFTTTLLRYMLMIISMGMDWFIILTLVTALSLGQLFIELRKDRQQSGKEEIRLETRRTEDRDRLLHTAVQLDEDEEEDDYVKMKSKTATDNR